MRRMSVFASVLTVVLLLGASTRNASAKEREFSIYFSVGQGAHHAESGVSCSVVHPATGVVLGQGATDEHGKVRVFFPWMPDEDGDRVQVVCVAPDGRSASEAVTLKGRTTRVKVELP